jgi:hypothetical protein
MGCLGGFISISDDQSRERKGQPYRDTPAAETEVGSMAAG